MRTLLMDGDIFAYASASAVEYECQWTDDLWTLHSHLNDGIGHLEDKVQTLKDDLKADELVFAFSDSTNFRKAVLPTYKHNRKDTRKPIIFKALKQYVEESYTTYQFPRLEGDDTLGILATGDLIAGEKIIVSLDKDMKGVPGLLFNDGKYRKFKEAGDTAEDFVLPYTAEEADLFHLLQTLTGDTTDGYSGCPGLGPKRAPALIEGVPPQEAWDNIVAAFVRAGLNAEVALQMARVARILRAEDYNIETGEIKLWQPANAERPDSTMKKAVASMREKGTPSPAEESTQPSTTPSAAEPATAPTRSSRSKTSRASSTAKGSSKS